jgi:hypothetical protein
VKFSCVDKDTVVDVDFDFLALSETRPLHLTFVLLLLLLLLLLQVVICCNQVIWRYLPLDLGGCGEWHLCSPLGSRTALRTTPIDTAYTTSKYRSGSL